MHFRPRQRKKKLTAVVGFVWLLLCLFFKLLSIIWNTQSIDHIRLESLAGDPNFLDFAWHRTRACMNHISIPYGCAEVMQLGNERVRTCWMQTA